MLGFSVFVILVGTIVILSVRRLHPTWWKRRWVKHALIGVIAMTVLAMFARQLGLGRLVTSFRSPFLTIGAGVTGAVGVIALLSLFFTVPVGGAIRAALGRALSRHRPKEASPAESAPESQLSRRAVLETAAASLPVAGLGVGAVGVAGAFVPTAIVPRPLTFPSLPNDLAGLKILQLTDVHLGAFMDPTGLVDLVERARLSSPDLVVLTGDICDHLPWLEAALRAVESLDPRLGLFAVMGNHEHYRGALATRRLYAKTRIELLDDAHRVVRVGGSKLVVSGVDDPVGRANDRHYQGAIDRALSGAPSDAFHLGLCHRPSGFVPLSTAGIDLTLSGHTHGAQIGHGDRSLLEPLAEGSFLRGAYEREGKRLYTSSGAGHWLAFRLDCPSEAALITLEKA